MSCTDTESIDVPGAARIRSWAIGRGTELLMAMPKPFAAPASAASLRRNMLFCSAGDTLPRPKPTPGKMASSPLLASKHSTSALTAVASSCPGTARFASLSELDIPHHNRPTTPSLSRSSGSTASSRTTADFDTEKSPPRAPGARSGTGSTSSRKPAKSIRLRSTVPKSSSSMSLNRASGNTRYPFLSLRMCTFVMVMRARPRDVAFSSSSLSRSSTIILRSPSAQSLPTTRFWALLNLGWLTGSANISVSRTASRYTLHVMKYRPVCPSGKRVLLN